MKREPGDEKPKSGKPRTSENERDFATALGGLLDTDSESKPEDDVPDELEDEMRQRAEYGADETDEG
jgi:hypothetical protein